MMNHIEAFEPASTKDNANNFYASGFPSQEEQATVKTAAAVRDISRGRGGRGRGGRSRGRVVIGEDPTYAVSKLDETSNTAKSRGRGKRLSQRGEASNYENSFAALSKGVPQETGVFIPNLSTSNWLSNIETHVQDPYSSEASVSGNADGESLHCTLPTAGWVPGVVSNELGADMQTKLDGHDAPHFSPSSIQGGGTLQQELVDFLLPPGVDSFQGDPACKSSRKRTKSRKVLENENLWRELTAASKDLSATKDLIGKDIQSTQSDLQLEEPKGAAEGNQDFLRSKESLLSNAADNLPEVLPVNDNKAKENLNGTAKRRKGQGLKERARSGRTSLLDQHDGSRSLHQASDVDLLTAEHVSYNKSALEGGSTHIEGRNTNYESIEVVEDWQSYCPYAPSSQNLIRIYEDAGPAVSSLALFTSSRLTPCRDKIWPEYYDLVLNAGGSVWALDWCPQRAHANDVRRQFLAVAAHPHDSPTHRLGELVKGRGIIQIWAFDLALLPQAQASWYHHHFNGQERKKQKAQGAARACSRAKKLTSEDDEPKEIFVGEVAEGAFCFEKSPVVDEIGASMNDGEKVENLVPALIAPSVREEFDPPQMVLGLAHDGGLVWDAKWQPVHAACNSGSGRLGYLAAIFGDGSIQVLDIPLPSLLSKRQLLSNNTAGPLVVRLKPVFKSFGLSSCGQKSMPLTVEWSASPPHDLLLAGCHDGSVALWMFDPQSTGDYDTRPLSCFVADTAPIRALAFAPGSTDAESKNVIVTGGHSGRLLFWDLRDPFYPLWDLSLSKGGCILSIDWLVYPSGIVLSMDDGTIKTLSLDVSCDLPVSGTPPPKSVSQGMHTTFSSDYAVWSVHVSKAFGIAIYGGEDGSIVHCQLTDKYFVNDRARAREPHFLCCKIIEDSSSKMLFLESVNSDAPLQVKNQRADSKQVPLNKASFSRRGSGSICEEDQFRMRSERHSAKKKKFSLLEGKEADDEDFFPDEVDPLALIPFDPNMSCKPKSKSRSLSTTVGKETSKIRNVGKQATPTTSAKGVGMLPEVAGSAVPSKAVAVHRVRWNQNRGCENLVCFGGAAGIVRCQFIMPRYL